MHARGRRRQRGEARRRAARWWGILGVLALVGLGGCQSLRSYDAGCPGIYSGCRYFADQYPELPADGKVFFLLDLPLTAVVDTLAVPFTAFADRERPFGGYLPGCRWAEE